MDPQATWRRMIDAYAIRDFETAQEAAEDLRNWLRRGGFPPQILPDPWQMDQPLESHTCPSGVSVHFVRVRQVVRTISFSAGPSCLRRKVSPPASLQS